MTPPALRSGRRIGRTPAGAREREKVKDYQVDYVVTAAGSAATTSGR